MVALAACGGDDDSDGPAATVGSTAAGTGAETTAPPDRYGDLYGDSYGAGGGDTATTAGGDGAATSGADVASAEASIGAVLVNAEGLTLYGFLPDGEAGGEPTCVNDCAGAWPPALVDGEPDVGELESALFTVVEHPDGSMLKAGDWPLYTFAGDSKPGDVNGQGSGGSWFAVAPDGTLID